MLGSAAARGDAIVGGTLLLSRERGTGLISTRTEEHRINIGKMPHAPREYFLFCILYMMTCSHFTTSEHVIRSIVVCGTINFCTYIEQVSKGQEGGVSSALLY
jgi:hypothetical protein